MRGKATLEDALDEAYSRVDEPRENFYVSKWSESKNEYGKSVPVEWTSFMKNNCMVWIKIPEAGMPYLYTAKKSETNPTDSDGELKKTYFTLNLSIEELGQAVIDIFAISEEYHKNHKPSDKWRRTQLELIDGPEMLVLRPKDSHFEDYFDYNSGEIYQWYSYIANDNKPCAHFYVGMANELNCNLEPPNVKNIWEYQVAKSESFTMEECSFGIFKLKAEMHKE